MIRGQVLGGSRVLPTEEIFAVALRVQDSLATSQTSQPVETSALIASGGAPRASGKSTSSGKTRTSYPPCKYCGKPTHPSEKCWKELRRGPGCLWRQGILDYVPDGGIILDHYSLGWGHSQPCTIPLGAGIHSGITGLLTLSYCGTISQSCGVDEQLGVLCWRTGIFSRYSIYLNSSYDFLGY